MSLLGQRRGGQGAREAAFGLAVHRAAHLQGRQRDVMRLLASETAAIDFPFFDAPRLTALTPIKATSASAETSLIAT
jgi:hypothetical protein